MAKRQDNPISENVPRLYHGEHLEVLYVGVTGDLLRRAREQQKKVAGFTAHCRVTELVYFEAFGEVRAAIAREKEVKGWLRVKRIALIESFNPRWKDLSAELQKPSAQSKTRRDSSLRSE